jgi:uncharacterized protein (TIGR02246 family)
MSIARRGRAAGLAVLSAVLGSLAGCSPSQGNDTEALAAIAEFNRQYLAAINGADIDALADLTTDDHMMIMSGGEPLAGKQALVDAMTAAFERLEFDESWTPEETVVSGDLAYQRGSFVIDATPKTGGASTRTTGNFMRIYRRQPDGAWLMVRDKFNSNKPRRRSTPCEAWPFSSPRHWYRCRRSSARSRAAKPRSRRTRFRTRSRSADSESESSISSVCPTAAALFPRGPM